MALMLNELPSVCVKVNKADMTATVELNDKTIKLNKAELVVGESYARSIVRRHLASTMCVGKAIKLIDEGFNYVQYEEMLWDEYNEEYSYYEYLYVYDPVSTYSFVTYLG